MTAFNRSDAFFSKSRPAPEKPAKLWFSRNNSSAAMSDEEAFLAILIGAARADGIVTPEEEQELAALTTRTKLFAKQPPHRISELRRQIDEKISRDGLSNVLGAASASILNGKGRPDLIHMKAESVFAHAVDLVFADRKVADNERDYIEELARQLHIDASRGKQIVSVIETKNAF